MSLNLASLLSNSARLYPELPAVLYDNVRLCYCDVEEAVARFAGELLGGGIQPGDKVALMIPNVPAFTIAYFGVLRGGSRRAAEHTACRERGRLPTGRQ